ncbi:unnamed protein product, partial [marine sediment metagenome]
KVAIITGAAVGIGEADARLFAKEGAKVVVVDIKEVEGRTVAESIKKEVGEATFIKLDVTKENDWERVYFNHLGCPSQRFVDFGAVFHGAGSLTYINGLFHAECLLRQMLVVP